MVKAKLLLSREEGTNIRRFDFLLEKDLCYTPGQYIMLVKDKRRRPFSIVNLEGNVLSLMIKKNGSFTTNLFRKKKGTSFEIFGPFGRFTLRNKETQSILIAGGIGITPLYSIFKNAEKRENLRLFYGARTFDQLALYREIKEIGSNAEFFLSEEKRKGFRYGRIPLSYLTSFEDFKNYHYYVCGPGNMIDSFRSSLNKAGVPLENIFSEEFKHEFE